MRLEIITFLTHMILLSGWEPPGYRRGYSRKGHLPCVRGEVRQLPLGRKRLYVCMLVYVCFREIPFRFQFYRTKCQSRKLRHVMFCNICIKNPNLRKDSHLLPVYKVIRVQKARRSL